MTGASLRPIYRYLFDDLDYTVFRWFFFRAGESQCVFLFLIIVTRKDCIETGRLTPNLLRIEFEYSFSLHSAQEMQSRELSKFNKFAIVFKISTNLKDSAYFS